MKTILCLVIVSLLTGCTATSYTDPSGAKFSRTSFLNKQSIGEVDVTASATEKKLKIKGYSNEQTEVAVAVATAVAAALAPAAKP